MIGTDDHAEIVRGLIRQIHRDEQLIDVSISEVDEQVHVTFHLQDIPYVGVTIIPMNVYVNDDHIVGHPDFEDFGHRLGETRMIQGARIKDLDLPGEPDQMGSAQNKIWLEEPDE